MPLATSALTAADHAPFSLAWSLIFASSDIEFLREEWFTELYRNVGEGMEYVMLDLRKILHPKRRINWGMAWVK